MEERGENTRSLEDKNNYILQIMLHIQKQPANSFVYSDRPLEMFKIKVTSALFEY